MQVEVKLVAATRVSLPAVSPAQSQLLGLLLGGGLGSSGRGGGQSAWFLPAATGRTLGVGGGGVVFEFPGLEGLLPLEIWLFDSEWAASYSSLPWATVDMLPRPAWLHAAGGRHAGIGVSKAGASG